MGIESAAIKLLLILSVQSSTTTWKHYAAERWKSTESESLGVVNYTGLHVWTLALRDI